MKSSDGFLSHPLCESTGLQEQARLLENKALGGGGFMVCLEAPGIAKMQRPGQFVHLVVSDDLFLRRPFSLMDADAKKGKVWVYGRVVGEGSAELARALPGQALDLIGPLGHPFDLDEIPSGALLVAGGTGAGVLAMLARVLGQQGLMPRVLYGAKTKAELSLRPWLAKLKGVTLSCSTDDGSLGLKGTVLDLLRRETKDQGPGTKVYVCGPTPMMAAAARFCEEKELECLVSLEQRMGCAVGACYACAFPIKGAEGYGSYVRVCRQGTVFDARELDWDKALGETVGRR